MCKNDLIYVKGRFDSFYDLFNLCLDEGILIGVLMIFYSCLMIFLFFGEV